MAELNEPTPQKHFAYGAADDAGAGYLVLEPLDQSDGRLNRVAYELVDGLGAAESLAARFNSGDVWAFRTDSRPLTGDAIPSLHRAYSGFYQCRVPYGRMEEAKIQELAAARHQVRSAEQGRVSPVYAVFSRDERHDETVVLLSPEASDVAMLLGSYRWEAPSDVGQHEWSLLYGDTSAARRLGLRPRTR